MNQDTNPWKVHSQTEVYDNKWISLTEFRVTNPGGGPGIYGKVHFKNRAIGVLPLDEEGFTWLVGQFRFTIDRYSWEIPEGGGPLGEDPLEAGKRELIEETGLVAADWSELMRMYLSNSVTDEFAIIYLARGLEQREPEPEETEQLAVRRVHFSEALRLVQTGEITDSMSVAAILQARLLVFEGRLKIPGL